VNVPVQAVIGRGVKRGRAEPGLERVELGLGEVSSVCDLYVGYGRPPVGGNSAGIPGVDDGLGVGDAVDVAIGVIVVVAVGKGVAIEVSVGVGEAVPVTVALGVGVGVLVRVAVGSGVGVSGVADDDVVGIVDGVEAVAVGVVVGSGGLFASMWLIS